MMLPNGWKKVKLGEICNKIGSGSTPKGGREVYLNAGIPIIRSQNVLNGFLDLNDVAFISDEQHSKMKGTWVHPNDILLNITGASIGRSCVVPATVKTANVNQHVCIIRLNECADACYVCNLILSKDVQKQIELLSVGGGRLGLNFQQIASFSFLLPPLEEQKKIAAALSVWDSAIEKMEKLIEAKENHFNQLMNKLIVINSSNSKWNTFALKNVFEVVNRKNKNGNTNILTSSAQYGLVNQQEYYKKKIASSNTSGYYLLKKGDFAYNRSYSTGYPYGVVKRLDKYELGVLSTLYLCFSLKKEYQSYSDFFVFLFESGYLNNQLALICREGARNHGLLNVSKEDFFNMKVQLPNEKEQQSIVCILQNHSQELSLLKQQLENYKKQKQGLMQKLLTGEWRVK